MAIQLGQPSFEERVQGVVDGSNTLFKTSKKYRPGTLIVFRSGQALVASRDNGFIEIGGKNFRMKQAPVVDDVIGAYYVIDEA
jgi:hypothetical protein